MDVTIQQSIDSTGDTSRQELPGAVIVQANNTTTSGLDVTIQQLLDSTADISRQELPGAGLVQANNILQHHDKQFRCHHSTINILHRRYQQTGTTRNCPHPGKQHLTTPRQAVWMSPFNNYQTPQEIPADRNYQEPATSRPATCYDTTPRSPYCSPPYLWSNAAICQDCTKCSTSTTLSPLCWLRVADLMLDYLTDRHRTERRRRVGYHVGMVCYSPTNSVSISGTSTLFWHPIADHFPCWGVVKHSFIHSFHFRNADDHSCVGAENVITTTTLSSLIDGMEGVPWCGAGSVIITQ